MDQLEKRIQALREEMDRVERPDRRTMWEEIQRQQGLTPIKSSRQTWRGFAMGAAASVAVLLIAGVSWWAYQQMNTKHTAIAVNLPPQWQKEQQEYQQLIENKMQSLRLENIDKNAYREVLQELEHLDSMQLLFQQELPALPKDDRTILILMRYYEQKIRILEILSKEIQIQQNEKERKHTDQSI